MSEQAAREQEAEKMLRQAASATEALRVIEQHHKIFGPGTGGVALHALAVLAAPLPKEERNKLCAEPTVGGADGLDPALREAADHCLSLSPMVMPHGLVRVVVVEQLYRVSTVIAGHPYHK